MPKNIFARDIDTSLALGYGIGMQGNNTEQGETKMPLPRTAKPMTAESVAANARFAADHRSRQLAAAPAEAARFIAAGMIGEVKLAEYNAKNRGDVELAAIYRRAIDSAEAVAVLAPEQK